MSQTKKKPLPGGVRYPWEKWFQTKDVVRIQRGKDFHCTTAGMAQTIRQAAARAQLRVSVQVEQESISFKVVRTVQDA